MLLQNEEMLLVLKNKVVNGMDVLEVRDNAIEAVKYCRSGKGPFILEMKTYRYRGHSMSDPAKYRTREEVDDARKTGPIKTLQNLIINLGVSEQKLKNVDDEIRKLINEAADFAINSKDLLKMNYLLILTKLTT